MYSGRTFNDIKNIDPTIGKIYYQLHPKDQNQFRTIRIGFNAFSGTKQPQYTQYVTGTPPVGMPAISPIMLRKLNSIQQSYNLENNS